MQEQPAVWEHPAVGHVADALVGEVELVPHGLEDWVTNHPLDGLGGRPLVQATSGLEEPESEAAAEDRGHRHEALAAGTEPLEALRNEPAHAGGQHESGGRVERAHGLHDDEGIAL